MYVQERVSRDENKTISVGLGVRPVTYRLNSVPHHSTTTVLKADLQGLNWAQFSRLASIQTAGASHNVATYPLARSLLVVRKGGPSLSAGDDHRLVLK